MRLSQESLKYDKNKHGLFRLLNNQLDISDNDSMISVDYEVYRPPRVNEAPPVVLRERVNIRESCIKTPEFHYSTVKSEKSLKYKKEYTLHSTKISLQASCRGYTYNSNTSTIILQKSVVKQPMIVLLWNYIRRLICGNKKF